MIQSISDVTGFVLAGGQSSRMGRDKALVRLAGKTLVGRALRVLCGAGIQGAIAGARSELRRFAPVVADDAPDLGPLGGVCTALRHTTAEWAVFTTIDLPLIPASLIRFLVFHAQITGRAATVCSLNGFAQTFPAVVRRDAMPLLSHELECGRAGCFAAFAAAGVSIVPVELAAQAGHIADERGMAPYQWFSNVNTPADLARAERIAGLRPLGKPAGTSRSRSVA